MQNSPKRNQFSSVFWLGFWLEWLLVMRGGGGAKCILKLRQNELKLFLARQPLLSSLCTLWRRWSE